MVRTITVVRYCLLPSNVYGENLPHFVGTVNSREELDDVSLTFKHNAYRYKILM